MKRRPYALALLALTACVPPRPPQPPAPPPRPTTVRLEVHVQDESGQPLGFGRLFTDAAPPNNREGNADVLGVGAWGGLTGGGFNVCAEHADFTSNCAPVVEFKDQTVTITLQHVPAPPAPTWTMEQLRDFQGDLMIWAPAVGCRAELEVRCNARGLQAGWVWSLSIPRYSAANRALLYAAVLQQGYTHVAVQVTCETGEGYHDLYPMHDCADYGRRLNTTLEELTAHNLIPICAGVTDHDAPVPGLNRALCPVVMDDWDNTDQKDCRVNALAREFPQALLFIEMPADARVVRADACSPQPFPTSGGEWIRAAQRRAANLLGVLYEINWSDGHDQNLRQLNELRPYFRDLQEVRFETDTYWKFWDNLGFDDAKQYNDWFLSSAPWLRGYMSGGTFHARPQNGSTGGGFEGGLDPHSVTVVHDADWRDWPQTTTLEQVTLDTDDVKLTFSAQNAWPDVSFGVQYSLGLCERIGGTWYCSAPIELWKGKPGGGGQIQSQTVDGVAPGQVPRNWFYDQRWGPMRGYQPQPGELVGIFVVAGDARNNVFGPHERSNIVLVKLPEPGVVAKFGGAR